MSAPLELGVNLNNREPLIAPGYGLPELLDLRPQCVQGRSAGTDAREVTFELLDKMRHLFEIDAERSAIRRRVVHAHLHQVCNRVYPSLCSNAGGAGA